MLVLFVVLAWLLLADQGLPTVQCFRMVIASVRVFRAEHDQSGVVQKGWNVSTLKPFKPFLPVAGGSPLSKFLLWA